MDDSLTNDLRVGMESGLGGKVVRIRGFTRVFNVLVGSCHWIKLDMMIFG